MDVDQPSANLEIVANDLDDATHSSMDGAVLLEMGGDPNEHALSLLLCSIVANSDKRLDLKYERKSAAVTLLADHPELRDKLMQAWSAQSFKELRNLSMCCSALLSWLTERCNWYRNSSTSQPSKVEVFRG